MTGLGTFTFPGTAGVLEGLYTAGGPDPRRAAVVCHPLPTHGGTMHNKVVYRAAKAFESLGYATLRFNFRGVGASEGSFDDGVGEADDVRSALDWMAGEHPDASLVVSGFSFGNAVALPVGAEDDRVTHLVGLGTPTGRFPFDRLSETKKSKLFVQGDRDEFGPLDDLRAGLERVHEPRRLLVIDGADHFFTGCLDQVREAIVAYFEAEDSSASASS